jgi:hypothetical protein
MAACARLAPARVNQSIPANTSGEIRDTARRTVAAT